MDETRGLLMGFVLPRPATGFDSETATSLCCFVFATVSPDEEEDAKNFGGDDAAAWRTTNHRPRH